MDDQSDRLVEAMSLLEEVADAMTPDEAPDALDETTIQMFWRDWPRVSSWAGAVWRRLNSDLAAPATPSSDHELDEVGGEAG